MKFALSLNQMLDMVARGLCNYQVVMIDFWNCVFMVASLVSYGGCSETVDIKKNGRNVFVVCNGSQRFAE
jgi:hypothetical protein